MKTDDFISTNTQLLSSAGIATARLDVLVLLEDVLNTNRTQILAHPERILTEVEIRKITKMLSKRVKHTPLAYIREKTEFYGRTFRINSSVLEPRPESEAMIDLLKSYRGDCPKTIIDIGTGSGALAITAALEIKESTIAATDISTDCIAMAKRNAMLHRAAVQFYKGDLLDALPPSITAKACTLLCNLPYVPDGFHINTAATHEPPSAIFGGADGLELYRHLFNQLIKAFPGQTYVFCESLPPQHLQLANIAKEADFKQVAEDDFIQVFVRN